MTEQHFVIEIEYLNDLALNIADNVPEAFYGKFCKELLTYLKCVTIEDVSDSESGSSSEEGSVDEEVISVSKDKDGFYQMDECDVKDCNSVGEENNNLSEDK